MRSLKPSTSPLCSGFLAFGVLALNLGGCGEATSTPSATAKAESTTPPPATSKAKSAKAKNADPTAEMSRDELKAYKKKMREEGKPL
ncbi:hypothetical protein OJF2_23240 [Aquisphaera giovannonii]|uniref:Uncharacterized protein n=1 Tax=Aquisphaera giovannonii TaxID=406548 RepID=A0A5B9W1B8_9BACT|nr:hypothetical protein [Aquisphaera giovannonii]QEH33795.1 hypothetical protein OJF2_23240 [Aquisphaera giovannonii]